MDIVVFRLWQGKWGSIKSGGWSPKVRTSIIHLQQKIKISAHLTSNVSEVDQIDIDSRITKDFLALNFFHHFRLCVHVWNMHILADITISVYVHVYVYSFESMLCQTYKSKLIYYTWHMFICNLFCRLHKQIMDIGGTKMKAAQSCVDAVNNKIDTVTGQITKAQVGIKTAGRWGSLFS